MSDPRNGMTNSVFNSPEGRTASATTQMAASAARMAEMAQTQVQLMAALDRDRVAREEAFEAERREREDAMEALRMEREDLAEERRQLREEVASAEARRRHFWSILVAVIGTAVGTVAATTGVISL